MSRDLVGTWYELMVARLCYTKPLVKFFELKHEIQVLLASCGPLLSLFPP